LGTGLEPDLTDAVVFVEDVGEPLYRLDRLLTQVRGSGRLRRVKALIGGSLHRCSGLGDGRLWWRQLLAEATDDESVPVVIDLPFGHVAPHLAFPAGVEVTVDTGSGVILWSG
jgi:muramoyltetrapeptide carboxypeptidase